MVQENKLYYFFNEMCSDTMNITVKNDKAESAISHEKNKLNTSVLTMIYPSLFTECVSIFSFISSPYLFPLRYFGS